MNVEHDIRGLWVSENVSKVSKDKSCSRKNGIYSTSYRSE